MTAAIEYAVRPAASPSPHGTTIIATTPGATRERATITWGAQATMPIPSMAVNTACCKEDLNEYTRETETVRIFQNNDSSSNNWVDVERALKVSLDKKENDQCNAISAAGSGDFAPTDFTIGGFEPSTFSTGSFAKKCKTTWVLKNNTNAG